MEISIRLEDGDDFLGWYLQRYWIPVKLTHCSNGLSISFDPTGGDGSFSAIDDEGAYANLGYTGRDSHSPFSEYPITAPVLDTSSSNEARRKGFYKCRRFRFLLGCVLYSQFVNQKP
jgi:hypothetical protein